MLTRAPKTSNGWYMAARRRQAARRHWPENLYQNGEGYFWYKNPVNGKTKGLGRDFKSAASKARAANTEIAKLKKEDDLANWVKADGMTLEKWCDEYEEKYIASGTRKPNTVKAFKTTIKIIRGAPFSKKMIFDVTTNDFSEWLEELAKEKPATAVQVRARSAMIFKAAEAKGHIDLGKNPITPTDKPRVVVARARLLLEDFQEILEKVKEVPEMRWLENAMLLGLVSGQRREDIVKMQFSQIHDGFLWIQQSKGKAGHESKVRIPTAVYLPQMEMSLDDVLKKCRDKVVSKNVIHHIRAIGRAKAGHPVVMDSVSDAFSKFLKEAKVKTPTGKTPATFHEIRSLSARLYADAYGEEFAQALLGHKSGRMTALYRDTRGQEWTEVKLKAS